MRRCYTLAGPIVYTVRGHSPTGRVPRADVRIGHLRQVVADADRLEGLGASISLVSTGNGFGGECHLDASIVRSVNPTARRLRLSARTGEGLPDWCDWLVQTRSRPLGNRRG